MDKNVIFNTNSQDQPVENSQPTEQNTVGNQNIASTDANAVDPQQTTAETEIQQEVTSPEGPPPPLGTGFHGSKWLKIIAGIVIFFIFIFLVMLFLPKSKVTKNVKLVWWGLWEDNRVIQPILDEFHRQHPTITVEYIKQDPQSYLDRLLTRTKNGSGPDIFLFHNTWYVMLSNTLLPFSTDVITLDEFKKNYYPVMQTNLVQNNAIYGIPMGADTLALFVNTDLLKAAGVQVPKNWDDFVKAAIKMTVKDDKGTIKTAGAAMGTFDNVTHAPDLISLLFVQQGVDMVKFLTETSDEVTALNFYTSFAQGEQNVWDGRLDESELAFAKGNLAMYFGYSWDIFQMQKLNPTLRFKVYQVPGLYGRTTTIASYWANGISSQSQNKQEAYLFLQYLAQKDTAQKLYTQEAKVRAFGELYARRDLAASLQSNTLVYPFVSQLENSVSSFFASDTQDGDSGINTLSSRYLENAINSMLNQNTSTDSVVSTLQQGIGQIFGKYGNQ